MPPIVFGVTDIDKVCDRSRSRGVKFRQEPTKTEWGTQAMFDDTCGNLIQLYLA